MIEEKGISTVAVSIVRKFTEEVKAPRAVFVKWPLGHPLGEPGRAAQHRKIIESAFKALNEIKEPGTIIDLPYRWKRHEDFAKEVEWK